MDNKYRIQFAYQMQNGRYIVLLKDGYRYDGLCVVECDNAKYAKIIHTDDGWKTINGSHVLIGKDGRIKAGAGGKFNGKKFGLNFGDYDKPKAKNGKRLVRVYKPLKLKGVLDKSYGNMQELKRLSTKIQKSGDATRELNGLPVGAKIKVVYDNDGKKDVYHFKKLADGDFKAVFNGHTQKWNAQDVTAGNSENVVKSIYVVGLPRKYKPPTKQLTKTHATMDGENLVAKKKLDNLEKTLYTKDDVNNYFEKITERQGFRGVPKIVSSKEEFLKAAVDTGIIMYRGYSAGDAKTADGYRKALHGGDWYTKCDGGSVFGVGMYTAAAINDFAGLPTKAAQSDAYDLASKYARKSVKSLSSRIECMTLVDANIIKIRSSDESPIKNLWIKTYQKANNCSRRKAEIECSKRTDIGVMVAELGYDAIRVDFGNGENAENHIVVLNRTKCVIYKDGADENQGDWQ